MNVCMYVFIYTRAYHIHKSHDAEGSPCQNKIPLNTGHSAEAPVAILRLDLGLWHLGCAIECVPAVWPAVKELGHSRK